MEKETGLNKDLCEMSIIEKETGLNKDQCETSIMEKEARLSEDLHKTSNKNKIKFKVPYNNTNNKPQVNRRPKSKTPYHIRVLKFKKKKLKSKRKHLNETRSNLDGQKDVTDSSLQPSNGDTTPNVKQKKQEEVMDSPDSPLTEDSQEIAEPLFREIYYSNEFFDPSQVGCLVVTPQSLCMRAIVQSFEGFQQFEPLENYSDDVYNTAFEEFTTNFQ
ncbi:hypothetical protein F8M41_012963 [Gigaspora margarita]|uniref:Uncharacterized protein n=1 Tax=Gigaspora margarita TaxID=4874 RepID=A0A8H4AST8_GIGMA|nr:hypothetical protein F8M41_012963 [Gigaspora margarita]